MGTYLYKWYLISSKWPLELTLDLTKKYYYGIEELKINDKIINMEMK